MLNAALFYQKALGPWFVSKHKAKVEANVSELGMQKKSKGKRRAVVLG
jgi:hypothetical protein